MKQKHSEQKRNCKTGYLNSFLILLITSIVSSLGGLSFQGIESLIATVLPIMIIFPSLNDLMGNFAIIFSSKFTTWLYEGKIREHYAFDNSNMKKLLKEIAFAGFQFSTIISLFGIVIAGVNELKFNIILALKVFVICTIVVQIMIIFLFLLITIVGMILFNKNKSPDDVLIPLSTSVADFLTMIYTTAFVLLLFK